MALDQSVLSRLRSGRGTADAPTPRRSRRKWWWLLLPLLLLAVFARPKIVEVETASASAPEATGRITVLNASGYVVARRIATVASKVTGRIVEVHVEEGQRVTAGEVLARLDDATARAAYRTAERAVESAKRAQAEISVRLADAERGLARAVGLSEKKLVAQAVLDTARADRDALAARLDVARAESATAEAQLAQRRQDLEDLVIRAPFTGVAVSKDAQPGEMVSPISAGGGFTRTGIATLVDMESRELEVDVNEAYIQRVHEGQSAEATLDAYPDAPLAAHVINIVPTADRQKATIKVRIALDRLEARVLPDMGIKVRFFDDAPTTGARPQAYVPASAVLKTATGVVVWELKDGRLHARAVQVIPAPGDEVAIGAGLSPGAVVVLRPDTALKEGARARAKAGA